MNSAGSAPSVHMVLYVWNSLRQDWAWVGIRHHSTRHLISDELCLDWHLILLGDLILGLVLVVGHLWDEDGHLCGLCRCEWCPRPLGAQSFPCEGIFVVCVCASWVSNPLPSFLVCAPLPPWCSSWSRSTPTLWDGHHHWRGSCAMGAGLLIPLLLTLCLSWHLGMKRMGWHWPFTWRVVFAATVVIVFILSVETRHGFG